ncbi:MAG: hypothetical protein ACPGJS_22870 [Flammeovirgaceae bacterium]
MNTQFLQHAKKHLFLGCFLLMTLSTQAQSDVNLKGYVVTNALDTIHGEVFDLQLGTTSGFIRVEHNYENTVLKFKDFVAYKRGSEIFVKREHASFKTKAGSFMQVMITGDVVLYRLDYKATDDSDDDRIQHDYYVEKFGGELAKVDRANFQNAILPFISDKPEIKEKVEAQEWVYDDLALIVKEYNKA